MELLDKDIATLVAQRKEGGLGRSLHDMLTIARRNILIDSNVDWGQDLLRLKAWMDENEVEEIYLGWFGTAVPEHYGINYKPLAGLPYNFDLWWNPPIDTQNPPAGIYAISATILWEPPLKDEEKQNYAYFRNREPDDKISESILIFKIHAK